MIVSLRKAYQNYLSVIVQFRNQKYPIQVVLRNCSKMMTVRNERELWYNMLSQTGLLCSPSYKVEIDSERELATIHSMSGDGRAEIKCSITNGDIWAIFVKDVYKHLSVRNKTVIDIGANIADSSIYFALQGANRILAIEPFPQNYAIARENISTNNLTNKVSLFLAGCGTGRKAINISTEEKCDSLSQLSERDKGITIPLLTLEEIVRENKVEVGSLLKMDCEGCEYSAILSESEDVLSIFSEILIEYHYGNLNLTKKLESCGFNVLISDQAHWNQTRTGESMNTGILYARRRY